MKQILVYGDSMSWGMVPGTRERYAFDRRWPGVLEAALHSAGLQEFRVVENCLPGRKTLWDDPFRPGRNGAAGLGEVIEMCSPLELVIIQLGTNDFQAPFGIKAWAAAAGVGGCWQSVGGPARAHRQLDRTTTEYCRRARRRGAAAAATGGGGGGDGWQNFSGCSGGFGGSSGGKFTRQRRCKDVPMCVRRE